MIELTDEQRQAVAAAEEQPPRIIDPATHTKYVLIREEVYDRVRRVLDSDEDNEFVREMAPQTMAIFGRDGWDDPAMDIYNDLDPPLCPMNVQRGEVVLVDYPFSSGLGAKVRPALVVQNDRDNQRLTNTILVQITSVTRRSLEPTQLLIDIATPDGQLTGLRQDSVVNCVNIITLEKSKVLRRLGLLSDSLLQQVNDCLRVALDLTP